MKIFIKQFGIISIISVLMLILTTCEEPAEEYVKSLSGTLKADQNGKIYFAFYNKANYSMSNCNFTTNLPAPDNVFSLKYDNGFYANNKTDDWIKTIAGLAHGQKVNWTAKSNDYIEKKSKKGGVSITSYHVYSQAK